MKEGEDYLIAPTPGDDQDWCVILKGQYDKVVGRYTDIEITEQGTKLSFIFVPLYQPVTVETLDTPEFQSHLSLLSIYSSQRTTRSPSSKCSWS